MAGISALAAAETKRPKDWDKWVSAAYLRILGGTQAECAKGVGRSRRTLQTWEKDAALWAEATKEAESRWLVELKRASMKAVLSNVQDGNPMLGFQVLERTVPELAPPKFRHEHTGKGGGPIEMAARMAQVPDAELFSGRDDAVKSAIGIG